MLPEAGDYETLIARFRWQIPERYNIARFCCDRWADERPDHPAILTWNGDGSLGTLTFRELRDRANQLANALHGLGLRRGERIALILPQSPETAIAHMAIYKMAGVALPLAALFGMDALEYRLANAGASAVITNTAGLAKLAQIRANLPELRIVVSVDGPDGDILGFDRLIDGQSTAFETADTSADDPAMMIYTSGTTGPAKGALHAHRVVLGHLPGVQMPHEFFPQPGDRMWTPADWAWAGGLLNILLPSLHFGMPVVAGRFEKFDPETAYDLMARAEVRNAFLPPTALKLLRAVPLPKGRHRIGLRTVGSGGESLGTETYAWGREALGVAINEFYGQTECNLILASCAKIGVSKPGFIGKAVPGHRVAVLREDGSRCAPLELGQIAVQRPDPVMFLEYWGKPDATRDKFLGDWLLTGDQGQEDEEGYVHFVGRDDDVITSAGYRIGPGEIEDCLLRHPAVALAAVIGKPDPIRTEIVKAFIVLREGYRPSEALDREVRLFVRERLSAHEYPREIAFVDSLPMTTTGKIIRRLLRDL